MGISSGYKYLATTDECVFGSPTKVQCESAAKARGLTNHVVGLVDAQQEDQLREEERGHQVPVNGVEVGVKVAQEAQQDKGEKEEDQGHQHCGVGDDLQREDVSMLQIQTQMKTDRQWEAGFRGKLEDF